MIPEQSSPTTIYIGFSQGEVGSVDYNAEGNVNYTINPGLNSVFTSGAPLELIIPAGQTTSAPAGDGEATFTVKFSTGDTTLGVYVEQVNLADPVPGTQPNGINNPVTMTLATPAVSIESAVWR